MGRGRCGHAFAEALSQRGWNVDDPYGRGDLRAVTHDVDLVLICVTDAAIAEVAASLDPQPGTVVAHVSGAQGLPPVAAHPRHGALHPLVSIPPAPHGAPRLLDAATFAWAGDPLLLEVISDLGGTPIEVRDEDRAGYHAAAAVASNHLVVLMAQVERVAARAGVPLSAFRGLVAGTLDNIAELGCAAALTGPAARGDEETVERHRRAIGPDELEMYDVMAHGAKALSALVRSDDSPGEDG